MCKVYTINTDVDMIYEVPATVNVKRAEWSLSDGDTNFFPNQKILLRVICFMSVSLTQNK